MSSARLERLLQISDSLAGARDLKDLLHLLPPSLKQVIEFDYAAVILQEPEVNKMRLHIFEMPVPGTPPTMLLPESLAGAVLSSQQDAVLDVENETQYPEATAILRQYEIKSCCYVPLTTLRRRLGAIAFGSLQPGRFQEDDMPFMRRLANQVAVAIDNARNFEAARQCQEKLLKERDQLRTLLEVSNAIASRLDLHDFLDAVSACLKRVLHHDFVAIALYEAELDQFRIYVVNFPGGRGFIHEGQAVPERGTLLGQVLREKKPVRVDRIQPGHFLPEVTEFIQLEGLQSGVALPLVSAGATRGTMHIASRQENAFSGEDVEFLKQIAAQVAIGVGNALAYKEIDELKDKIEEEKLYLEEEIRNEYFDEIVGVNPALLEVLDQVRTVAETDSTVLVLGETGTGKELIARAIHNASRRRGKTFVKLNCSAIPTGLLESELFGHEKGAFTGAIAQKIGRMELADRGTMFLDEIGDIPPELQPKLLRALQEREFERLGGSRTIRSDVRLIAATNRDLAQMVASREFRSDLYYRLNVFPIKLPPLRERPDDIPRLVRHFAAKHAHRMNRKIETIPSETMRALRQWHWPGNVRELENFIERAVILSRGSVLNVPVSELQETVPPAPIAAKATAAGAAVAGHNGQPQTLQESEREHILKVLRETRGVLSGPNGAAARLGLKRTTLQGKMKKLGIGRESS